MSARHACMVGAIAVVALLVATGSCVSKRSFTDLDRDDASVPEDCDGEVDEGNPESDGDCDTGKKGLVSRICG